MRGAETSLHDAHGRMWDVVGSDEEPVEIMSRFEVGEMVRNALKALPPVHAEIVRRRYCIAGSPFATQSQLAEELGMTRQRVQQIEQDAVSCRLHEILTGFEGV